jgi:hypothetical protein
MSLYEAAILTCVSIVAITNTASMFLAITWYREGKRSVKPDIKSFINRNTKGDRP